jgi:hypothetical protein
MHESTNGDDMAKFVTRHPSQAKLLFPVVVLIGRTRLAGYNILARSGSGVGVDVAVGAGVSILGTPTAQSNAYVVKIPNRHAVIIVLHRINI